MSESPEDDANAEQTDSERAELSKAPDDDNVERARTPHDEFAKAIFGSKEEAISLLRSALPQKVSELIEWSTLSSEPTEQIDRDLKKRLADLLFRVSLKGKRRDVLIDVVLEHQSSNDRTMAVRMLGLVVRRNERLLAADANQKLPIVLPVVLFQGEGKRLTPWRFPTRYTELLDADDEMLKALGPYIPDFEFVLDDLTQQSREMLYRRQLTVAAWLALTLLREATSNPHLLEELKNPRDLEQWRQLSVAPNGAMVLEQIWVYLYRIVDLPDEELHDFARTVGELAEKTQMSAAQRIIDKAAPRLRAEGRVEGRVEGRAATLKRQVARKFVGVEEAVMARIDQASEEELELWTERILFASSLEELFRE